MTLNSVWSTSCLNSKLHRLGSVINVQSSLVLPVVRVWRWEAAHFISHITEPRTLKDTSICLSSQERVNSSTITNSLCYRTAVNIWHLLSRGNKTSVRCFVLSTKRMREQKQNWLKTEASTGNSKQSWRSMARDSVIGVRLEIRRLQVQVAFWPLAGVLGPSSL